VGWSCVSCHHWRAQPCPRKLKGSVYRGSRTAQPSISSSQAYLLPLRRSARGLRTALRAAWALLSGEEGAVGRPAALRQSRLEGCHGRRSTAQDCGPLGSPRISLSPFRGQGPVHVHPPPPAASFCNKCLFQMLAAFPYGLVGNNKE